MGKRKTGDSVEETPVAGNEGADDRTFSSYRSLKVRYWYGMVAMDV